MVRAVVREAPVIAAVTLFTATMAVWAQFIVSMF